MKRRQWGTPEFWNKYGSLLAGTAVRAEKSSKALLAVPSIFFFRRAAFVLSMIFLGKYLCFQLLIQMSISMSLLMFLRTFKPLESDHLLRMETFNEFINLILTYVLFCFTSFVSEAETRSQIGYAYIGISLSNISVHLILLIIQTFKAIKLTLQRQFAKR